MCRISVFVSEARFEPRTCQRESLAPCQKYDESFRNKNQRRLSAFLLFFLFILCGTWARAGRARTSNIPSIIPDYRQREEDLLPVNMMYHPGTRSKDDVQLFFSSFSLFSMVPGLEQGEPGQVISPPLSPDYRQREEDLLPVNMMSHLGTRSKDDFQLSSFSLSLFSVVPGLD